RRSPNPIQWPRRVGALGRFGVEQRVTPSHAATPGQILHDLLLRRVYSLLRVGLFLDVVDRELNGFGEGIARECRAGLDGCAILQEVRFLGGVGPWRD